MRLLSALLMFVLAGISVAEPQAGIQPSPPADLIVDTSIQKVVSPYQRESEPGTIQSLPVLPVHIHANSDVVQNEEHLYGSVKDTTPDNPEQDVIDPSRGKAKRVPDLLLKDPNDIEPEDYDKAIKLGNKQVKAQAVWIGQAKTLVRKIEHDLDVQKQTQIENRQRLSLLSQAQAAPEVEKKRHNLATILQQANIQLRIARAQIAVLPSDQRSQASKRIVRFQNRIQQIYNQMYSDFKPSKN